MLHLSKVEKGTEVLDFKVSLSKYYLYNSTLGAMFSSCSCEYCS